MMYKLKLPIRAAKQMKQRMVVSVIVTDRLDDISERWFPQMKTYVMENDRSRALNVVVDCVCDLVDILAICDSKAPFE